MTSSLARPIDELLEGSVVGGFSKVGIAVRRRLFSWQPLDRMDGKLVAITGATSGLGRAMAEGAAALGADVILAVRNAERGESVANEIRRRYRCDAHVTLVDMSNLESVNQAASELSSHGKLDALVHNAGSLNSSRQVTVHGDELTFATHVLGPYLLTVKLLPTLQNALDPRVVVVTSGGMYTQPLDVTLLDCLDGPYVGSTVYARCKRAQVSLVEMHRNKMSEHGVLLAAYHPGWADTEGVRASLPRFRTFLRPVLRTPDEGADTALWLLSARREIIGSNVLYCDRAPRSIHRLSKTARSDTETSRVALDELCRTKCELELTCP